MNEVPTEPPISTPQAKPSALSRAYQIGRLLLFVLVLAGAAWALSSNWSDVEAAWADLSWSTAVLAFVAVLLGICSAVLSWTVFVEDMGPKVGLRRNAQIFLVGQLGKYIPGSVWAYVMQVELGRRAGVGRARVFAATVFSLATIVAAATISGLIAVPQLVERQPSLAPLGYLWHLLPVILVCCTRVS